MDIARLRRILGAEKISIPKNITLGVVCGYEYYDGMRGGKKVKLLLDQDGQGHYIDLYVVHDNYSEHFRIDSSGTRVRLENFISQFGLPTYVDEVRTKLEHQEIKNHNQLVFEVLRSKGFE